MKTKVQVQLEDGSILSPVSNLRIAQFSRAHHRFEFKIPLSTQKTDKPAILKQIRKTLGKPINIKIIDRKESNKTLSFKGIVTGVECERTLSSGMILTFVGSSPTIILQDGIHCKSFYQKTIGQICEEVLGKYPSELLSVQYRPKSNRQLEYVVQYKETNFDFINRLLNTEGEAFFFDGKELIIGESETEEAILLRFGNRLNSLEIGLNLYPSNHQFISYDYLKDQLLQSKVPEAPLPDLDPFSECAHNASSSLYPNEKLVPIKELVENDEEIDAIAERVRKAGIDDLIVIRGLSNNPVFKVATRIKIIGGKATESRSWEYGEFKIFSIYHTIDSAGVYGNQFEALPSTFDSAVLTSEINTPFCEVQPAIVKKNDDPEALGRVRVHFFWQTENEMSPWIRMLSMHAGDNRGTHFLPEINDQVMVAFEGDDPHKPFVLGSLFHGNAKPGPNIDSSNNDVKLFSTRSGNQIRIVDKPGEEEICITNKDEKNEVKLSLGDGEKIRLKSGVVELSANKIILDAPNVEIKSTSNFKVECGEGDASISAKTIKLN